MAKDIHKDDNLGDQLNQASEELYNPELVATLLHAKENITPTRMSVTSFRKKYGLAK